MFLLYYTIEFELITTFIISLILLTNIDFSNKNKNTLSSSSKYYPNNTTYYNYLALTQKCNS